MLIALERNEHEDTTAAKNTKMPGNPRVFLLCEPQDEPIYLCLVSAEG